MRSHMRASVVLAFFVLSSLTAQAEQVRVVDDTGHPVANAVVTVSGDTASPAGFGQLPQVMQRDLMFHPYVLVVPQGTEVEFPNFDRVRHHVYSFSKGNRFELELYGREEHRTITFSKTGTAAIGCNIHDSMVGYIRVVDSSYGAVTDADGIASIANLPDGVENARVWHPDMMGEDATSVAFEMTHTGLTLALPGRYVPPPAGAMR